MRFTAELEGLDELTSTLGHSVDSFESDLRDASLRAAKSGIQEARVHHPYRDRTHVLTGDSHAVPVKEHDGKGSADMVWPAGYAGFVDEGTSRSKPYPFTPQAIKAAEKSLERATEQATDKFVDGMNT